MQGNFLCSTRETSSSDQAVPVPRAAVPIDQYPLKNSSILDSATTIHIFNEIARFIDFHTAPDGDFLWVGDSRVPILGYGDVDIQIEGPKGKSQVLRLYDVAYCENFAANLVSFRQLQNQGYWWDTRPRYNCLRRGDDTVLAILREYYSTINTSSNIFQMIIHTYTQMAFYIRRHKFNSSTERRPVTDDAMKWHLRLGHTGPQALEHLVNASKGVRLSGIKTVNCDSSCGMAKAKRPIRREPRGFKEEPGVQLALDFHDYLDGYGGYKCLLLITDRWSGCSWDYYLTDHKATTILAALNHLLAYSNGNFKFAQKRSSVITRFL